MTLQMEVISLGGDHCEIVIAAESSFEGLG